MHIKGKGIQRAKGSHSGTRAQLLTCRHKREHHLLVVRVTRLQADPVDLVKASLTHKREMHGMCGP
eukprot:2549710-Pleurochrysis_carterae.AAC.1